MERAAAAPRSPETLKKAKAAIDALAQDGFITASEAATEAAALREEALAYVRSVGRRRSAVLQHLPPPPPLPPPELTATIAPMPPLPPPPSAPQPRTPQQQGEPGYVEAAVQRLQQSSVPTGSISALAPRGRAASSYVAALTCARHCCAGARSRARRPSFVSPDACFP